MKFAICFVIGDTEMHDSLCGKYNCRNSNISVICRHCDCPTQSIVDPAIVEKSKLFTPERLDPEKPSHDSKYFQSISHHPIQNSFHSMDFGCNKYNIHLASPGELLHMHQLGVSKQFIN